MRKIEELIDWLAKEKVGRVYAAVFVIAFYFAFQTVTLSLLSAWAGNGVSVDDAEQLIYLQHLAPGYGGSQPPLYNWITWVVSQATGTNITSLKLAKYFLLFVGFSSVHAAMRKLGYKQITAAAAMLGMMTVPLLFWEAQHTLTHSVAAFAFSAVTLLAFAYLVQSRTPLAYLAFGLAAGLAMLAKFNDVLLLVALFSSALSVRAYRQAMVAPQMLLSLTVFVLVLTPTAIWSYGHLDAVFARVYKFDIDDGDVGMIVFSTEGLVQTILATVEFSIVTFSVYAVGSAWKWKFPWLKGTVEAQPDKLLRRALLLGISAVLLLMLISGSTSLRSRWLLPILFLLPLYLSACAEILGEFGREVQRFVITSGVAIALLTIPFTWYAQLMGGEGMSRAARLDYRKLYQELQATVPVRTIVGNSFWIGNFRLARSDLVLLVPEVPDLEELLQEPAVLMWPENEGRPNPMLLERLRQAGYELSNQIGTLTAHELLGPDSGRRIYFAHLSNRSSAK
ncbi:glycosyltransferase family 39 protein [Mesorhizobium sp. WSM3873]|uniref:ArnT family glycosyltransferase n=1 Tax=Mesorhizobium sp. WSM3873 TaxID=1854056 RepID=UPI000800D297|nr:glycosyltransferase family 39 protein [Mesorhizobium sp. WSM3873]OBQ84071.1 hypothetical protein A9K71_22325 [Mesorhizobium sp. WSM3873]